MRVGQPRRASAENHRVRGGRKHHAREDIAKRGKPRRFGRDPGRSRASGGPEPGDRRDALGARPLAALLAAAADQRLAETEVGARGDQRPRPFRPPILWADSASASAPSADRLTSARPANWTASQKTNPPAA